MNDLTSTWRRNPDHIDLERPDTWYKGQYCNRFPFDRAVNVADVIHGWRPANKLIGHDTKVMAFGSCFAEYFIKFLAAHGYNRWQLPKEEDATCDTNLLIALSQSFENLFVIVQHVRWAFGDFTPTSKLWFAKDKTFFEATEERRARVRRSFEEGEVFILTLGLSEVWFDKVANEPMWRSIPARLYEPERYVCKGATVADTVAAFYEFDTLADRLMPDKHFIFTLSPVPLVATFRNQAAVTANQVSKSVLRAALDEFITNSAIEAKGRYHYFPSYELVLSLFDRPFLPDNRHPRPEVAQMVLDIFSSIYTDLPVQARNIQESYVASLESQVRDLQRQLVEKEKIILDLDKAAHERLELIERLTGKIT